MTASFVLIGPPGSGKGTQAKKMSSEFSIPHISTGDMFRAEVAEQTDLGKKVSAIMEAGDYVSDDITNAIVRSRLSKPDVKAGFILDGYPRTVNQAQVLEEMISDLGLKPLSVLLFEMPREDLVERLTGRLSCPSCGAVFHQKLNPPTKADVCDQCGHQGLITRDDDSEETVRKRLGVYDEQTQPLVDYYRNHGEIGFKELDASQPVEQLSEAIFKQYSG